MRIRGARFQELLLGLALLAGLVWNFAKAAEINHLHLDSGPTGTRAELALAQPAEYKVITLSNPDRLVIDLPGSRLASGFKLPAPAGLVKSVRSGHPEPGVTRIVFDLASAVVAMGPRMEPAASGARLVVEWPEDAAGADPIAAIIARVSQPEAPPPAANPAEASNAATDRLVSRVTGAA